MKTKALFMVIAVVLMITLVLTGCAPTQQTQTPAPTSQQGKGAENETGIDISRHVKIIGYLMGEEQPGFKDVLAELNKRLTNDINASMEINYIGWGEWQSQYPLILASGEDVDWIYTANWCFYFQEAAKGAFYEIKDEDLKKYMPRYYALFTEEMKKQALVNGKVYMIPTVSPDKKIFIALIRGDLRKKYGVPEIKKFSEIEPYLEAIKKNEPTMIPLYLDSTHDIYEPYVSLLAEMDGRYVDVLSSGGSGSGICRKANENTGKLYRPTDEPLYSNSIKVAKIMKSWKEKGYINEDVFANNIESQDSFKQGKSGVAFGNSVSLQETIANATSKGWEVEIIPLLDKNNQHTKDPYINNGFALAANTKNPERTMMAMDLICQDKDYNFLVYYGIEGKNYVIKDGKIDLPEGLKAEDNDYPPDSAGFWFTNKNQHLPLATWSPQYVQLLDDIQNKGYLVDDILVGFNPDTTAIKTEIANLSTVGIQYMGPIYVGMVGDVEEAFRIRIEKLQAAGIEKVYEELTRQVQEYLKNR